MTINMNAMAVFGLPLAAMIVERTVKSDKNKKPKANTSKGVDAEEKRLEYKIWTNSGALALTITANGSRKIAEYLMDWRIYFCVETLSDADVA